MTHRGPFQPLLFCDSVTTIPREGGWCSPAFPTPPEMMLK